MFGCWCVFTVLRLVGDHTIKSQLLPSCVTESKFADDAVLYASFHDGLKEVTSSFVCGTRGCGFLTKSKGMVAGIEADTSVLVPISVEESWWRKKSAFG